jgi:hypothetical protein
MAGDSSTRKTCSPAMNTAPGATPTGSRRHTNTPLALFSSRTISEPFA